MTDNNHILDDTRDTAVSGSARIYQATVYARRIFTDLMLPDEADTPVSEYMREIKNYLDGKPDICYAASFTDNRRQRQAVTLVGFQKLMDALNAHNYDCLVLYSVSLFASSYKENSYCLLTLLPEQDIRILSIRDDYDSLTSGDAENGYPLLRQLVDKATAEERSRRVKLDALHRSHMTLRNLMTCPFGYCPDPNGEENIIVDEPMRPYVQHIFSSLLNGSSPDAIAKQLNEMGAPAPTTRKEQLGIHYKASRKSICWTPLTVTNILASTVYTGDLVLSTYRSKMYIPPEDLEMMDASLGQVVEKHHEALVSREDFDRVQILLRTVYAPKKHRANNTNPEKTKLPSNPYRNRVHCARCGAAMAYSSRNLKGRNPYTVYVCSTGLNLGWDACSRKPVRYDKVDATVRDVLARESELANTILEQLEADHGERAYRKVEAGFVKQQDALISQIQAKISEQNQLFSGFSAFSISPDEYYSQKAVLDAEFSELSTKLAGVLEELRKYRSAFSPDNLWIKRFSHLELPDTFTISFARRYIEDIIIDPDGEIKVKLVFSDLKNQLLSGMEPEEE